MVDYVAPLVRAWERTRSFLFRPMVVETWVVVGFAAFLARLVGGGFWTGATPNWRLSLDDVSLIERSRELLALLLFLPFVVLAVVLGVLLLWISSRAKFVFLEDALAAKAAIVEPWQRHRKLGSSLFLWRLAFYALVLGAVFACLWPLAIYGGLAEEGGFASVIGTAAVLTIFGLAGLVGLAALAISVLLESFVVPVMYRYGIGTNAAWRLLLPLLARRPLAFLGYLLFIVVLRVALAVSIVIVGCSLCCIPLFLLSIPYLSSVLLLPVLVALRLYSVEFLAQFGEELTVSAPAVPVEP